VHGDARETAQRLQYLALELHGDRLSHPNMCDNILRLYSFNYMMADSTRECKAGLATTEPKPSEGFDESRHLIRYTPTDVAEYPVTLRRDHTRVPVRGSRTCTHKLVWNPEKGWKTYLEGFCVVACYSHSPRDSATMEKRDDTREIASSLYLRSDRLFPATKLSQPRTRELRRSIALTPWCGCTQVNALETFTITREQTLR
jgi:hypothetical protein